MKLTRKLKICLVLLLILSFASTALATPGKYVQLKKDHPIPWDGWCFDERAVSSLIVDKDIQNERCNIKIERELNKKEAEYNLKLEELNAQMDYEVSTRDTTIQALQEQNLKLEEIVINESSSWHTYVAGGFVIGATFVLIVWVAVN